MNVADLDRTTWLAFGMEHGWLEHQCVTHEGLSYTQDEAEGHEEGLDPCVVRYIVIPGQVFGGSPDPGVAE